jgi:hypothetical protein
VVTRGDTPQPPIKKVIEMNSYTMLTDRVASLLPNTTAGACVPVSIWKSYSHNEFCGTVRTCHYSCYGRSVCGPWVCL